MKGMEKKQGEQWSSRLGFIMAALGMAIGTGNIWRFPRVAGSNGGGAFMICYVIANIVWVAPLLMMEIGIGKAARLGTIGAFRDFYDKKKSWFGAFICFVCAVITFYYTNIFAHAMRYFIYSIQGVFASEVDAALLWENYTRHSPVENIIFLAIAVFFTIFFIYRGVKGGLEVVGKTGIPVLFVCLLVATLWSVTTSDNGAQGLRFLFVPKFSQLKNINVWLNAFTQASWSAGAGWGQMLTYANYFKKNEDISTNAMLITFGDQLGALLGGMAVMCAVFALSASSADALASLGAGNYGLAFVYLAGLFPKMPGGSYFAMIFFLSLSLAALTSNVSQTETVVRNFVNNGFSRKKAAVCFGIIMFICGIPSAVSIDFNNNQDWVWGIGLLVCGLFFLMAVSHYGIERYRNEILNKQSDFYVGKWFNVCLRVYPFALFIIIGWWCYQSIFDWHPEDWWHPFRIDSLGTIILQIGLALIALKLLNNWYACKIAPGPLTDLEHGLYNKKLEEEVL